MQLFKSTVMLLPDASAGAEEVSVLVPAAEKDFQSLLERLIGVDTWSCFSDQALAFCDIFSSALLKDEQARSQPDIVAFAFWLRKSQVQAMLSEFVSSGERREAQGLVFQIAPGNVDTVFIYSAILSFLLGNTTLVRVSTRMGESAVCIIDVLNYLLALPEYSHCAERICIVQYPSNDDITRQLSNCCQLRVIWGGDESIERIQSLPLEQPVVDVVFPDRYSAALIQANTVTEGAVATLVEQFCRDALPYGQQACSSPRTIYWVGDEEGSNRARNLFWNQFRSTEVVAFLPLADEDLYQRELFRQQVALELGAECKIVSDGSTLRLMTTAAIETLEASHCGLNTFFEIRLVSLSDLGPRLGDKFQTLTVAGVEDAMIAEALVSAQYRLIKRVVPMGQALTFSHHWDGVNLLDCLTRLAVGRA